MNPERMIVFAVLSFLSIVALAANWPYAFAIFTFVSHSLLAVFDAILGGHLNSSRPFSMWMAMVAVMVLTTSVGMIAPAYGFRKHRTLLFLIPALLMVACAVHAILP